MYGFPVAGRTKCLFLPNDSSEMVVEPFLVSLSTGVAQLDNKPAIVGVYLSNKPGPVIDALVRVDHRIVRQDPAVGGNRHVRCDNRANSAAGEFLLPVDPCLGGPGSVVVVELAGDTGPENPILSLELLANLQRSENDVLGHTFTYVSYESLLERGNSFQLGLKLIE